MKQSDRELIDQVREWFSLDKYSPSAEFGPEEWADQITKRAIINNALMVQDDTLRESFKPFLNNAIHELLEAPLSHFGFGYKNRPNGVDAPAYGTPTILPLSFNDIGRLTHLADQHQPSEGDFVDAWSIENPDLGLLAFGHLVVDLNARDEDIITDFKRWLTNFRNETNRAPLKPHPKASGNRFAHWQTFRLGS